MKKIVFPAISTVIYSKVVAARIFRLESGNATNTSLDHTTEHKIFSI